MLIGLISDTHIPERANKLPNIIFDVFKDVDMIIHAGDMVSLDVKDELEKIAEVHCVQGNMDRVYGLEFPKSLVLDIENFKVGIIHGEVYPKGDTLQLKYLALELGVDILVTGHSHQAFIEKVGNIILLNPGSPTAPRLTDPTVMLLRIEADDIDAEIIKVGAPVCKALNFEK